MNDVITYGRVKSLAQNYHIWNTPKVNTTQLSKHCSESLALNWSNIT